MAANTSPIFLLTPRIVWLQTDGNGGAAGPLKTANNTYDGTGTVLTIFTAGANGSALTHVTMKAAGTNVLSLARFFVNNGSTSATLGNNSLIGEMILNATTASATAESPYYIWAPPNGILLMPASYTVNVVLATTVAAGYVVTAYGGDF